MDLMNMKRIHVLLIVLLLCLGGWLFRIVPDPGKDQKPVLAQEINWLVKKYGPKRYSQGFEELIIRDFFRDKKNGYFVDVGASHHRINSTTYLLEKHLGWNGIAVDAIADYAVGYQKHRKNTLFFHFYVGDISDEEIDFYIVSKNKRLSSGRLDVVKKHEKFNKIKIPTIRLNDLLEHVGVTHFDFLSMDIELAEPEALAGFDISRYKPHLVCIEAHEPVLMDILNYFSRNNYRVLEQYKKIDSLNLYFTPGKERRRE